MGSVSMLSSAAVEACSCAILIISWREDLRSRAEEGKAAAELGQIGQGAYEGTCSRWRGQSCFARPLFMGFSNSSLRPLPFSVDWRSLVRSSIREGIADDSGGRKHAPGSQ